jgi:hypothetical protein
MVQIIKRKGVRVGYDAQEPTGGDKPNIKRPPDSDIPEFDDREIDQPAEIPAPPFTGEDVEQRKPVLPTM